ncbi:hypothetical protein [Primorskyibacter marinus]|uniref:hypothetical protein n=1 Tax=Primorskyibacter marinus TaxID=1977320 RepID=UPI000E309848|nr:hypothetical protein [Primorskyibacter marinus]
MEINTELMCRRKSIAGDLGGVAAWCRYRHHGYPRYTLIAAAMIVEHRKLALEPSIAEKQCNFDSLPILQTASEALSSLGYKPIPATWPRMAPGILVFEAPLSTHEQIRAVDHFLRVGLPSH